MILNTKTFLTFLLSPQRLLLSTGGRTVKVPAGEPLSRGSGVLVNAAGGGRAANATIYLVRCHGWGINTVCLNLPVYTSTTGAGWLPWQQVQHTKEVDFSFFLLQIHPDPAPNLFSLLLLLFNNLFILSFFLSWPPLTLGNCNTLTQQP